MDETVRRADRDRHRSRGGVPADGLLRRVDGRRLPPVFADSGLGDGAVGAGRADPDPGARGDDPDSLAIRSSTRATVRSRASSAGSTTASIAPATFTRRAFTGCSAESGARPSPTASSSPSWPFCSGACRPASCPTRTRARSSPWSPSRPAPPCPGPTRRSITRANISKRTRGRTSRACSPSAASRSPARARMPASPSCP